jgi:hypothetical protein
MQLNIIAAILPAVGQASNEGHLDLSFTEYRRIGGMIVVFAELLREKGAASVTTSQTT